jgi:hypothetical protein
VGKDFGGYYLFTCQQTLSVLSLEIVENMGRLLNKFRCAVTGCSYIGSRHRYDIHMPGTNVVKYKNGVHSAGVKLFFCILSEVKS